MKREKSGCCFLFVCMLFLLPGIYLIKDRLPDSQTLVSQMEKTQKRIGQLFSKASGLKEVTEEEKAELLSKGQAENGCSYYYWLLDEQMRIEYMKILEGIQNMDEDIDLRVDEDSMKQVVKMVFADHPELFWLEQSYDYSMYDSWVQIHPRYTCSAAEREERAVLVENTVQEALQSIPEGASAYQCVKALYTYVVKTVDYDVNASDNQNLYSSMVNRVSVCSGYAKELQYLLQRRGIQALFVEGDVEEMGPHAWLIASVDGEFYHVDPTFGDPTFESESLANTDELPEMMQVEYAYLCCDNESILKTRTISTDLEVPECDSTAYLYYPLNNLYFDSYSEEVLISLQESIDCGYRCWEGQFADEYSYEEMISAMQDGVFADLVLVNHPDWESVQMNMSYRDQSLVVKLWY